MLVERLHQPDEEVLLWRGCPVEGFFARREGRHGRRDRVEEAVVLPHDGRVLVALEEPVAVGARAQAVDLLVAGDVRRAAARRAPARGAGIGDDALGADARADLRTLEVGEEVVRVVVLAGRRRAVVGRSKKTRRSSQPGLARNVCEFAVSQKPGVERSAPL